MKGTVITDGEETVAVATPLLILQAARGLRRGGERHEGDYVITDGEETVAVATPLLILQAARGLRRRAT